MPESTVAAYCKVCHGQWDNPAEPCAFGCKPARYNVGRMFHGQPGRFVGLAVIEAVSANA